MTDLRTLADDLDRNEGDWTGVTGDVEYTFLNPGYLPDHWIVSGNNLEDWVDNYFSDDALDVDGLSLDQRKVAHFVLDSIGALVGAEGTNERSLPNAYFSTVYNDDINYRVSYSDVADISFSEKIHNASDPDDVGQIAIAINEQDLASTLRAQSFTPADPSVPTEAGGDIIFGSVDSNLDNGDGTADFAPGEQGAWETIHELGHSVGLADANSVYTGANAYLDNQKYTIMSYEPHADMGGGDNFLRPMGLQLLDIYALHTIYGANYSTRSEDNSYSLGAGFGFFDDPSDLPAGAEDTAFIYTIWDGEGDDTIDSSAFNVASQIDLRQGHFSSIGKTETGAPMGFDDPGVYDAGNVAIAYDAVIENAVGTDDESEGDILIGNGWVNTLTGGAGDDILYGDGFVYDGDEGLLESGSPDGDAPAGDADNDTLDGGTGADEIYGGLGDDTFIASDSNGGTAGGSLEGDLYHGGGFEAGGTGSPGSEIDYLDDGYDLVDYSGVDLGMGILVDLTSPEAGSAIAWDSGTGFTEGTEDTLISIEDIVGTAYDDMLLATPGGDNFFDGGDGIDTVDYSASTEGLVIDMSGAWLLENVEIVIGTNYDDQIILNPSATNGVDGQDGLDIVDYSLYGDAVILALSDIGGSTAADDGYGNMLASVEGVKGTDFDDTFFDAEGVANYFSGGNGSYEANGIDTIDYSLRTTGIFVDVLAALEEEGTSDSDGNIISGVENFIGSDFNDRFVDDPNADNTYDGGDGFNVLDFERLEGVTIDLTNEETIVGFDVSDLFTNIGGFINVSTNTFLVNDVEIDGYFTTFYEPTETDRAYTADGVFDLVYHDLATGNFEFLSTHYEVSINGGTPHATTALFIVDEDGVTVDGIEIQGTVSIADFSFWGVGTSANDVLIGDRNGSSENDDTMNGYDGDDALSGGGGNDTMYGGTGDDVLQGGSGNDSLDGGDGVDAADYSGAASGVSVSLASGSASDDGDGGSDTLTSIENLTGSDFNDLIEGSSGNNVLSGGSGTDTLSYASAASAITVSLATTSAQNTGGAGTDTISGFENIIGSAYNDTITGSSGNNTLAGGAGNDNIDGGAGTDTIDYSAAGAAVTVSLASGTASNDGDGGSDTLSSIENVTGSAYADTITGSSGNNILAGGAGNDVIDGGAGTDTVDYSAAAAGATVNLTSGTASNDGDGGSDTISNVENVTGSAYADTITGSTAANVLSGGGGNDTISGGNGNDTLVGGSGNDSLDGGGGADTVDYSGAGSAITVSLASGSASNDGDGGSDTLTSIEYVVGSAFNDTITGSSGKNFIWGGDGNDTIDGGTGGQDTLYGEGGNDTLSGNSLDNHLYGGDGEDVLYGGDGQDTLNGDDGDDLIYGGDGNDSINGGTGNDEIHGGDGNDFIIAGGGSDIVYGDAGDDDINGSGDNDILYGGDGDDDIDGNGGNDFIYGGDGLDILTGGVHNGGSSFYDVYVFEASSAFNDTDIITDWVSSSVLEISDLLTAYNPETDDINDFINLYEVGADTYVAVDADGGGDGFLDVVKLQNKTGLASVEDLIESRNLVIGGENIILGTGDANTLTGTSGADIVFGDGSSDTVYGGDGNDYIKAAGTVYGEAGDDILVNATTAQGGDGNDTIIGAGIAANTFNGNDGDDLLIGNGGADTLYGDAGNDILRPGAGNYNDVVDGGSGTDTVDYSDLTVAMTINLSTGSATGSSQGTDTLTSIENVIGSAYGDTITGSSEANVLVGGAGNDSITGGAGADMLYGQDGQDDLYGGDDADTFVLEAATAFNNVDQIHDFATGENDVIDISDILSGYYTQGVDDITDFVRITDNGTDSTLAIDQDGGADNFVSVATILGVTGLTDEAALESAGRLVTV